MDEKTEIYQDERDYLCSREREGNTKEKGVPILSAEITWRAGGIYEEQMPPM